MTASYHPTLKNTRMANVVAAVDAGAGIPTLEIGTANMGNVLVVINLPEPSFNLANDVITLNGVPRTANAIAAGTAAAARIKNGSGAVIIDRLTVAASGADIALPTVIIGIGDPVTISSFSIQHSP